jgi:hypothetical protein
MKTLQDYVNDLNEYLAENPDYADRPVVYSVDDEGNDYNLVNYTPTEMHYDVENRETIYCQEDFDDNNIAICIN